MRRQRTCSTVTGLRNTRLTWCGLRKRDRPVEFLPGHRRLDRPWKQKGCRRSTISPWCLVKSLWKPWSGGKRAKSAYNLSLLLAYKVSAREGDVKSPSNACQAKSAHATRDGPKARGAAGDDQGRKAGTAKACRFSSAEVDTPTCIRLTIRCCAAKSNDHCLFHKAGDGE